ncbi:MAG: hypothetical protein UW30_C0001G0016 [Candidatus Giovannonibacteria bacterium GW2011_GWA2_44_13b]|uniref:Uncharacterized protein n=2 Tax=Candidatus Giovannoniibacteriota TaxID=1752738 RepID=A0A0G1H4F1_9BACT|nr:MAG: hypothetical protein UW30_C0001G0016 [Candidatus Giovannonibacteria bacterium GW2011_GWA2_44_13b]OGF83202.1 MAG: hypothetical protein A2924_02705 [Candidatus Giovannonibacteria bacterium RIFCSPLOWO2_01_FULL_44_16]
MDKEIAGLQLRISQTMDTLIYINDLSGKIFDNTFIEDDEIEFAEKTPHYKIYRDYKIKLIAEFEALVEKIAPSQSSGKNMDLWFFIAAEYAFLGTFPEKVKVYSEKLDWKNWNPAQSRDVVIFQIFRELQARAQKLNPNLFKTPDRKE